MASAPNLRRRLLLLALVSGGCGSANPSHPETATRAPSAPPWQISSREIGKQTLFRVQMTNQRGSASLRMVLRLENSERYDLTASDALGRQLWALSLAHGSGFWVDHRTRRQCSLADAAMIPDLGFPSLRLAAVPALLLGRLPFEPAGEPEVVDSTRASWSDGSDRWSWQTRDGELASWSLSRQGIPVLWWQREATGGVLSAREQAAQIRWRQVLIEPLLGRLPDPHPADGYAVGRCDESPLP